MIRPKAYANTRLRELETALQSVIDIVDLDVPEFREIARRAQSLLSARPSPDQKRAESEAQDD